MRHKHKQPITNLCKKKTTKNKQTNKQKKNDRYFYEMFVSKQFYKIRRIL